MADRTVTINSVSKRFSVTGWRVGWTVAPPDMTSAIRKVHDLLSVGAGSPLQAAAATALSLVLDSDVARVDVPETFALTKLVPPMEWTAF